MANRFSRYVTKIYQAPTFLQQFLLTRLFCSQVKLAQTCSVKLLKVSNAETILHIANKKHVRNHIGGVHAIAAALLAESATGIVVGMNVPDSHLPLLKSMTMNFKRRMQGALTAKASLTDEQINAILTEDKGDLLVKVEITDESGEQPIECIMDWAWVPKRRDK